ncbi:hypothetical protein K470DRAFT_297059 [Piedraia hortae CBS 480.64]|uniref:Uncharacterized protein n=1 Tax=Piedraia hortae CBS 480.64 TaxID=1314780 RepID=A0A6A7BQA2_9PEZI|nr:hypothetical protein K470DRAFT_297059 [Piedraia hortae CBS 480.64]
MAQRIPTRLLESIHNKLNEGLYADAISILKVSVDSGLASSRPAQLPPPTYLAWAASLAVHPQMTNRTNSQDKKHGASLALQYLRAVLNRVGSVTLKEAFVFEPNPSGSRGNKSNSRTRHGSVRAEEVKDALFLFEDDSLWKRAPNFWTVVGWAFNCSVQHRKRWEVWLPWLEVILDVLESDLAGIQNYVRAAESEHSTERRQILRAIFADGSRKSLEEFGEIWLNETELPEVDSNGNGVDQNGHHDDKANETLSLGDYKSIELRQRLLALLVRACREQETTIWESVDDFFLDMADYIRPLPLDSFQRFLLARRRWLSPKDVYTLARDTVVSLLGFIVPEGQVNFTQSDFIAHYAPHAANTAKAINNAKVSVVVESMLTALYTDQKLTANRSLQNAIAQGIVARSEKCKTKPSKTAEAEEAAKQMEMSALQMGAMLELL